MEEILDFIKRRFSDTDAHWLDGNCYWFAVILTNRFVYLDIYYEPVIGHFYAGFDGRYFDVKGEAFPENTPMLFTDIYKSDYLWYNRIINDCVL